MKLRSFRLGLRSQIIAWSFIPTALILFAIALLIFYAYQRLAEDLVVGRNEELTRRAAGQLSSDLASYVEALTPLARMVDIYSGDPTRQPAALKRGASRLAMFDGGLLILNHLGKVVTAEPARPEWSGQDWSSRGFFQQMLHTTGPAFSDILRDNPDVIGVAVPILDDQGEFQGVLLGVFQLGARSVSAFYGDIVKLRLGNTGSTYLVDSTGRVVYHANDARIGSDMRSLPAVQQVLKNQVGYLRTHDVDGRDILASFAPVPGTPWGLVSEQPLSELLLASQGYGQFLLVLLALGLIVPTLVVAFGVKRITDPLRQLIDAAREIAGGKFGQVITVHTGDELGALATQFNVMSNELSTLYTQLEQRVVARTKELATLNAIAAVVNRSLDLNEILNAALDKAMETMRMETGAAYSFQLGDGRDEDGHLVLIAQRGLSAEFSQRVGSRRIHGTAIQVAAEAHQSMVWLVANYPDPGVKQALELEGVQQVINIPLFAKAKLVGAFNLGTRHERQITPEEISLLDSIGQQIAVAVENAHLYDQAEQSAAVAERHRLSRELHDSVTQSLYGVTMYAEAAARLLASGKTTAAAEHLRELRDTAQEALREMRLLIFELRPLALEKMGLVAALSARLDTVEIRGGVQAELQTEGVQNSGQIPYPVQETLYHIAQEALNNALKHANAQHVLVRLVFGETATLLEICDDGAGFMLENAAKSGGLGLSSMEERAQRIGGKLQIETSPGQGTRLTVEIPRINGVAHSNSDGAPGEGMQP